MGLIDKGLLTVEPEVLTWAIVVTTTSVDQAVKVHVSDVGAPIPDDLTAVGPGALDPEVWRTPHEDLVALRGETDNEGRAG